MISLSSATISNTQPIRGGDYDSLSCGYTDMGKSGTTLDIREPPRFIWSLIIRSSQKSQSQLSTDAILTPYAALVLRHEENEPSMQPPVLLVHFSINQNCGLTPCHFSIGITKSMWTKRDTKAQFQTMRPMPLSTECGLTPMPLRVLCYSRDISGNTHVESEIAL